MQPCPLSFQLLCLRGDARCGWLAPGHAALAAAAAAAAVAVVSAATNEARGFARTQGTKGKGERWENKRHDTNSYTLQNDAVYFLKGSCFGALERGITAVGFLALAEEPE
jgi:hypothetical protein